ncbi:DUF1328 family protein [Flavobacterium sp. LC2016-01]|uniref:DUF1328 family protein n=1 Tax=Flavobacterium sp. LC2016-01 TaxID=2675876 RepID=UPI0012BB0E8B|nr:DUF1328 family protein [Flavobacterium sp. LC2016-01]MTH15963.1 DUF1328 domain-containing protein [Flavobacterium sp. LC2016-01]
MSHWTVSFSVLTIIAGIFGFGVIDNGAESIAQLFFFIFLILTIITIIIGRITISH